MTSTATYTPPTSVPSSPANNPTITATTVDLISGSQAGDSFSFNIVDGTCGTGHESILNGQYAFLARGGAPGNGYNAFIGSFTADGAGHITGGLEDINRTVGVTTGLTINPTGSSYSVGADNRGCLTFVNSSGGVMTYRIALGTLSMGVATQGTLTVFVDDTGNAARLSGILMLQNSAFFSTSSVSGNYVFRRGSANRLLRQQDQRRWGHHREQRNHE